MKKIITLVLFSLCFCMVCGAQENNAEQKAIAFGVRGGLNIANHVSMSFVTYDEYEWIRGYNFGVTCDFRKSENFLGRTGLFYSAKGCKETYMPYTHLNYLEVPVLAVYQKPIGNLVSLELQAGVYFAYGVGGECKEDNMHGGYDYTPSFKDSDYKKAQYKRFDWGWNVGAGVNIGHVYLGGAYEVSAFFGKRHTNHCFMIDLGYNF